MLVFIILILRIVLIIFTLLFWFYSVWISRCITGSIHCNEQWEMPRGVFQFLLLLLLCAALLIGTLLTFGCVWSLIFKIISVATLIEWVIFFNRGFFFSGFNLSGRIISSILLVVFVFASIIAFSWNLVLLLKWVGIGLLAAVIIISLRMITSLIKF